MIEDNNNNNIFDRRVLVLYGSQTGCARDAAESLTRSLIRRHFKVQCNNMDSYDKYNLPNERVVLFVCSTTGQGEMPDNMKHFWKFILRSDLPCTSLQNTLFSVFGLGDSGYPLYNASARKLYQRVLQLGGVLLYERGMGDDQDVYGYDERLNPWIEGICSKLLEYFPLESGMKIISEYEKLPCKYIIEKIELNDNDNNNMNDNNMNDNDNNNMNDNNMNDNKCKLSAFGEGDAKYQPVEAKIILNKRMTPMNHFQDVRHIIFDTKDINIPKHRPGDVVAVHPRNNNQKIMKLIQHLGYEPTDQYNIYMNNDNKDICYIPMNTSLYDIFELYLDIEGTPSRYYFTYLSTYATDTREKDRLKELGSSLEMLEYYRYCVLEKRTYSEILYEFPSVKLSLDEFMSVIPRLEPRLYSISSSLNYYPNEIHITLAIFNIITPYKRKRIGLCSSYLSNINYDNYENDQNNQNNFKYLNNNVYISIRKGAFTLPNDNILLKTPIIMIGPGTGISPFLAMCEELYIIFKKYSKYNDNNSNDNDNIIIRREGGGSIVYFGNRNKEKDFLHEEEWNKLINNNNDNDINPIRSFYTAWSRDTDNKVYIQDIMKQTNNKAEIKNLIFHENCYIFLAGNSKNMPIDVYNTLINILCSNDNDDNDMNKDEAVEYIKLMQRNGRFQMETWS